MSQVDEDDKLLSKENQVDVRHLLLSDVNQVDVHNHLHLKKRNRSTIVCTNCKTRKLKCDRQSPCSSCSKSKHYKDSCIYKFPEEGVTSPKVTKIRKTAQTSNNNNILLPPSNDSKATTGTGNSIFHLKLKGLKSFSMVSKKSKTMLAGPASPFLVLLGNFGDHDNTLSSIKNFFSVERKAWKLIHGPTYSLPSLINTQCNLNDVVSTIQRALVPNCNAILERLSYFRDYLNDLLYNGFVDMSHITECFNQLFTYTQGNYYFNQPEKSYAYSELSLILAVVESTTLFSEYETTRIFKFSLDLDTVHDISQLATQCLSLSNFQRKRNFSSLIALIILKDNHYLYSSTGADSMDESNSMTVSQMLILLAFQLGLHRDPTSITRAELSRNIMDCSIYQLPPANSRIVWNHLRMIDAIYSVRNGTPLLINDLFSDSISSLIHCGDWIISFTKLEREAAMLFNSIEAISIDDVVELIDKFLNLNSSLGTFKDLISPYPNSFHSEMITTAQKIRIKFKVMRNLCLFYLFLQKNIANIDIYPKDQLTPKNLKLIKDKVRYYKVAVMKFSFVIWGALKELSKPNTTFGNDINKYIVYLKDDLLQVLYPSFIGCTFSVLTLPSLYKFNSNDDDETINLDSVDYRDVELALNSKRTANSVSDEKFLLAFCSPRQSIKITTEVYSSISKISLLTQNYGYFCLMKLISIFSCFIDSMLKLNVSLQQTDDRAKELLELTRAKVESTMKLGYVDLGFSLENDENSIQNWLDSIFDENGFFTFLDSTNFPTNSTLDLG